VRLAIVARETCRQGMLRRAGNFGMVLGGVPGG
jgi:hypothetical protein